MTRNNWISFGGGINSTALIIECWKREVPIIGISFANTGGEKPETYEFIARFKQWAHSKKLPPIITVRHKSTLEQTCLDGGWLPSIAYGHRGCSRKFKGDVQDKLRNNLPECKKIWERGEKINLFLGIDYGEPRRIRYVETGQKELFDRPKEKGEQKKYQFFYPLYEWGMTRHDCIKTIKEVGLPVPPKSSCFFCPASKPHEIIRLQQTHPELFERAIRLEQNAAKNLHGIRGLGGHRFSWSELTRVDKGKLNSLQHEMYFTPPCFCLD